MVGGSRWIGRRGRVWFFTTGTAARRARKLQSFPAYHGTRLAIITQNRYNSKKPNRGAHGNDGVDYINFDHPTRDKCFLRVDDICPFFVVDFTYII
jgi:hypothetical protein